MQRYPDIEIYLASVDIGMLEAWLREAFDDMSSLDRAGKRQWRGRGRCGDASIPVLLVENAADSYASLWFDSAGTPWMRDVDCARAAAARLQCEVRCSLGGWQPGDDPDRFWQIQPDGTEAAITWPDSGR
ncbi:hypothetical protein [Halomonas sp. WWR20]